MPADSSYSIVYDAGNASIEFGGASGQPNVNPQTADIIFDSENQDVVVDGWSITNDLGAEIAAGTDASVHIPALPDGRYTISFTLTRDGIATATVGRSFHIAT